tara:strand:- start:135 stop:428 length:294 start_codon:yes stop_codon:yes gene_type:complete
MDDRVIIEIVQQAMLIILQLSWPVMTVGLVVGVAIALLQALTQVQEMTLTFVPKIIAIFLTMFIFFPSFTYILTEFTMFLADQIIAGDVPATGDAGL